MCSVAREARDAVRNGRKKMSSRGASATAFTGRGSSAEMSQDTYRVVLPSLPTGTEVLNSVFAHCDITGRPYKIDDFRGEMERHGVLNDLIGAGAYQMNHVWLFTFNSLTAKRKILVAKELVVKEKRCLLIDPDECEVRIRLHWIPIHISDDTVRRALEPYGKINEVSRDTWRAEGFQNVRTTTRLVRMNLKEGVTKENLPRTSCVCSAATFSFLSPEERLSAFDVREQATSAENVASLAVTSAIVLVMSKRIASGRTPL